MITLLEPESNRFLAITRVDYLAKNRELHQLIKRSSPLDPDTYSDPTQVINLQFPFLGIPPKNRFKLSNHMFAYMGREGFRELWEGISKMENDGWNKLFLYGTAGYGKSHMLAALACLLISQGKGVVYLPDCRAMLQCFVRYIKEALLLTFGDSPKRQKQVEKLETEKDIEAFLYDHARLERLYFIVDQINALESTAMADQDIASNAMKTDAVKWLGEFSFAHCLIESASPNYRTFQYMKQKQTNDIKIATQGGLSQASS